MIHNDYSVKLAKAQEGVVLAVALIMLVLITLLGVSAMRSTIMEERMASNSRNDHIAFQLAESTLRQAEENLLAVSIQASDILNASTQAVGLGACEIALNSEDFNDQTRWDAIACDYAGEADNDVTRVPHYFIEFVYAETALAPGGGAPPPVDCFYRITSRGYGPDVNSTVTLQTTFRFDACQ